MRRKGTPAVLAVSLAVLASAWFLAESTAGRLVSAMAEAEPGEEPILLGAGKPEEIRALAWDYEEESVSLIWDDAEGRWSYAGDRACPLDPERVESLVTAAAEVCAGMKIANVKDFAQYGLEEPELTVTVETEERSVMYEVGNRTIEGEYYLRLNGENTVYTGTDSLPEVFRVGLEHLITMESAPGDIAAPKSLTVTGEGENYTLVRQEDGAGSWYGSAYEWYAEREGETLPVSAESARRLWEQVGEISFLSCVDWNEENFSRYGLNTPQATAEAVYLTAKGEEKTFTLCFGDYVGEQVYVNIAGSEKVYQVSGSLPDELMYPDWEAMTPLTVCPVDLDGVSSVAVALGGHIYEIDIHREARQEVDTEGNLVTGETVCYVANGWTLPTDGAALWLAGLTELTAESLAGEARGREELLSVSFLPDNEEWPEVTLSLRSHDSIRCLCLVNETEAYFISRSQGEALVAAAERLLMPE